MNINDWCASGCPVDCDDVLLAVPEPNVCPEPNNEEVTELFWSKQKLVTGDTTEWSDRLSNTATDVDAIRRYPVRGKLPRVEPTLKTTKDKKASVAIEAERVLSFEVEDDSDAAHEFLSQFQCGLPGYFWFNSGKHTYGDKGISGSMISSYEIDPDSEMMAHNWQVQLRFSSICFPPRVAKVM